MAKSLVLSVSAGTGCYRHIQIGEDMTLFNLHEAILEAFDFDDDHMHTFFMNNRAWDETEEYICPNDELDDAKGFSDEAKLSKFRLRKDNKFLYIFDFGVDWQFRIKVLRISDEATKAPIVLRSHGEISQYGDYDEDEE